MISSESRIRLLVGALLDREQRTQLIAEFQKSVWDSPEIIGDSMVWEILSNLALDLSYYVSDPNKRREDPSYYGDERVEEEIRSALEKLKERGIPIPFDDWESSSPDNPTP
jgi:hypothetical protein